MKSTTKIKVILFLLLFILTNCISNGKALEESGYPKALNYQLVKISRLKTSKVEQGLFNTEGYVVKIFTCPPCPPGADCKPCMHDNIVISEKNQQIETYNLTDQQIIIFGNNVKQFKLGNKYLFSIKIKNDRSTNEPINDIELLGYTPLD